MKTFRVSVTSYTITDFRQIEAKGANDARRIVYRGLLSSPRKFRKEHGEPPRHTTFKASEWRVEEERKQ